MCQGSPGTVVVPILPPGNTCTMGSRGLAGPVLRGVSAWEPPLKRVATPAGVASRLIGYGRPQGWVEHGPIGPLSDERILQISEALFPMHHRGTHIFQTFINFSIGRPCLLIRSKPRPQTLRRASRTASEIARGTKDRTNGAPLRSLELQLAPPLRTTTRPKNQ